MKNKKFKFEDMNTEEFINYLSTFGFPEPEIVEPENAGVFFEEKSPSYFTLNENYFNYQGELNLIFNERLSSKYELNNNNNKYGSYLDLIAA